MNVNTGEVRLLSELTAEDINRLRGEGFTIVPDEYAEEVQRRFQEVEDRDRKLRKGMTSAVKTGFINSCEETVFVDMNNDTPLVRWAKREQSKHVNEKKRKMEKAKRCNKYKKHKHVKHIAKASRKRNKM